MEELVNAVQKLGNRDVIDLIGIFSPILLSLVAIVISIHTMQKQNKIALLEKKYNVITKLRLLMTFDACLKDSETVQSVLATFDSLFGTDILELFEISREDAKIKVSNRLKVLQNEIMMGEFFLESGYRGEAIEILKRTRWIVYHAIDRKTDSVLCEELHDLCSRFKEKHLEQLIKRTKL